tara:strand:+ start:2025 stop:2336 length:312 start_codon:yes stop_codon:yes gene_type:complete
MKSTPTRYACYENYSVSPSGRFVEFSEFEKLDRDFEITKAEVTHLKEQLRQFHAGEVVAPAGDHALSKEVAHLKDDEIKFLKAELEEAKRKQKAGALLPPATC